MSSKLIDLEKKIFKKGLDKILNKIDMRRLYNDFFVVCWINNELSIIYCNKVKFFNLNRVKRVNDFKRCKDGDRYISNVLNI